MKSLPGSENNIHHPDSNNLVDLLDELNVQSPGLCPRNHSPLKLPLLEPSENHLTYSCAGESAPGICRYINLSTKLQANFLSNKNCSQANELTSGKAQQYTHLSMNSAKGKIIPCFTQA